MTQTTLRFDIDRIAAKMARVAIALCSFVGTSIEILPAANGGELSTLLALGPINVSLVDLDPQDNISPHFRWTQNAWTNEIEREAYFHFLGVNRPGVSPLGFGDPRRTMLAGDIIASLPGEPSYAKVLGDAQGMEIYLEMAPGPTQQNAYGYANFNLDPTRRYFTAGQSGTGDPNFFGSDYTFEVSAKTAIVFSMLATATVRNTTGALTSHFGEVSAAMHAGILESEEPADYMDPSGFDWYPYVHDGSGIRGTAVDNFRITNRLNISTGLPENNASRLLSVRYENLGATSGVGYFYVEATGRIVTAAVTVPEPRSAAIGLVGCLFIGWRVRFRKSRRRGSAFDRGALASARI
jgi:hypothetical protein